MDGGLTSYGIPKGISNMKEYFSPYSDGAEHLPLYHWAALVCATIRLVNRLSDCDIRVAISTSLEAHGAPRSFERDGPSLHGVLHSA